MDSTNQQRERECTYFLKTKKMHRAQEVKISFVDVLFFYSNSSVLVHLDPEYL